MVNELVNVPPQKKLGRPPKPKYAPDQWDVAKKLVIENSEISLAEIAKRVNIPLSTLESRAVRKGWLSDRDINNIQYNNNQLHRIIQQVALQMNDMHAHTSAMIEALQYSHRIKIIRDVDGSLHYINFDDYPDKPPSWNTLSAAEQEALLHFISPMRLTRFLNEMLTILGFKTSVITFVTRIVKDNLPKIDPTLVDMTRRDGDTSITDNVSILSIVAGKR